MEPRAVTFFEWSWYILYNGKCFAKSNAFKQWRVSFSHIMIICKIHNVVLWVEQYPLWILIVVHVRRVDDAARFTSCNFLRLMITISLYHSITVNSDVARKSNFTFSFKYNLPFYKSDHTLWQGISYNPLLRLYQSIYFQTNCYIICMEKPTFKYLVTWWSIHIFFTIFFHNPGFHPINIQGEDA